MTLSLEVDATGLADMITLTRPGTLTKITTGALRYAGGSIKPAAGQSISGRYGLGSTRVKADVSGYRMSGPLGLEVTFKRKPPPTLRAYGARPRTGGYGVTAAIFKGGPRSTISRGFFVPFSGVPAPGVPVVRTGPGRGDLKTLYGPSIGSIFARDSRFGDEIRAEVGAKLQERFVTGYAREMARVARGY